MVIPHTRTFHNMHRVSCRYACSNQCCICGDADLGIAKLSGDSEFLDSLARLILHRKSVQAWRMWNAAVLRCTSLQLAWRCYSPTDNPVRFLLWRMVHGGMLTFLSEPQTSPHANASFTGGVLQGRKVPHGY